MSSLNVTPSIVVMGAPGLGKSTFAASVTEVVPASEVLLMVTKPGEEKSFGYVRAGLNESAEVYYDRGWRPSLKKFKAEGFLALMERLYGLQEDERYGVVILDPGTDAITLIDHHIMEPFGVGSPGELSDTQGYYRQLKDKSQEFVQALAGLSTIVAKRPKIVIIPWHVQPAKEGVFEKVAPGQKVKKESADEKAAGVEYEGSVLPMIEGSYRRKLMGDVDLVVYCDLEHRSSFVKGKKVSEVSYVMQVVPNEERHAKVRTAPALFNELLPNNFKALLAAMEL